MHNSLTSKESQDSIKAKFEQRQKRSIGATRKGLELYVRAKKGDFQDRELVKKAIKCFVDSIKLNRKNYKPYLFLAQIFIIFRDYRQATNYLKEAKRLVPDNPDVDIMIDYIARASTQKARQSLELKLPSQTPGKGGVNYDKLYDDIEQYIVQKIKAIYSPEGQAIKATIDRQQFEQFQENFEELKENFTHIEMQLEVLEQEMSTTELRAKLKPFTALKKRYVHILYASELLMEINDTIELWSFKTNKQVQVVNQELTMSALTYGKIDVERMKDGCDLIADQLDDLSEDKKVDISSVEPPYVRLLKLVDNLEDDVRSQVEDMEILF